MPLIGPSLAVIVNAAWIGFLTYCVPSSSRGINGAALRFCEPSAFRVAL